MTVPIRSWVAGPVLALSLGALASSFASGGAAVACAFGLVDRAGLLYRAALLVEMPVPANSVEVEFLAHSSFVIHTPKGVTTITDFNGYNTTEMPPDAVTMNNSHETHYTDILDPRIPHVLRGWRLGGGLAHHDVTIRDMRVFNVPTNISEYGDPASNGNSVFIFEISGLCIAHTSLLHHVLTRDQLLRIGRIDVLFVPIDGGLTIGHEAALGNIRLIDSRLVIPMHFGFDGVADTFFGLAKNLFPIRAETGSVPRISRKTLPR